MSRWALSQIGKGELRVLMLSSASAAPVLTGEASSTGPDLAAWLLVVVTIFLVVVTGLLFRATDQLKTVTTDMRDDDRKRTFMEMHRMLIDREMQDGRRTLHHAPADFASAWVYFTPPSEKFTRVNSALAMLDAVAYFASKGYIDREDFLDLWAPVLVQLQPKAETFIDVRMKLNEESLRPWPHLTDLLVDAAARQKGVSASNEGTV